MSERIFLKVLHRPPGSLRIDFNILLCSFRAFNQQAAADSPKAEPQITFTIDSSADYF